MKKNIFQGKTITVFGLGLHGGGVGTVKFLATQNPKKIIVTDIKTSKKLAPSLKQLENIKGIKYVLGQHRREDFIHTDMVIKTPAVSWKNEYIKLALEKGIPVETDSSLFFQLCTAPIVGITGTKGKTSTAMMVADFLKAAKYSVVSVGIGQISVLDKLSEIKKDSWVVFELSSWRLAALRKIKKSPAIAVITNILPDHLNYYSSLEEYINDKKNIFLFQKPQDWLVYNKDNSIVTEITEESQSQLLSFSQYPTDESRSVFINQGNFYLNNGIDEVKIASQKDLKIKGAHNQLNLLASIGAAYLARVPLNIIKKTIKKIDNIPHRLELVKTINDIKYYNDTAATIPEAVQAALDSFDENIILILGGTDKKLDFNGLAESIVHNKKIKGIVFLKGTATDKLILSLQKRINREKNEFEIVDSMPKAVEMATRIADRGDVILLSPGAASFGLFNNEFDRGNQFKKAVDYLSKNYKFL